MKAPLTKVEKDRVVRSFDFIPVSNFILGSI